MVLIYGTWAAGAGAAGLDAEGAVAAGDVGFTVTMIEADGTRTVVPALR
jgi:hypothetical protein